MSAGPGYISWSQYDKLSSCGEAYRLQYHEKVPQGAKGYFIGGQAVHETIQEAENTGLWADSKQFVAGGWGHEHLTAVFTRKMQEATGTIEWGGRKSKKWPEGENASWWCSPEGGLDMLERYASLRREDDRRGLGLPKVEVKVTATLESGKLLLGYIDQLFDDRVRDWKTGSTFSPGTPFQLVLYEHLLRAGGHEPRHVGEYVFLRARDARLVFTVNLDAWVDMVPILLDQMEARLASGIFTYSPGKQCGWCNVAEHCEVGKRLNGNDEDGDTLG